jgi:glutathione S-transferase
MSNQCRNMLCQGDRTSKTSFSTPILMSMLITLLSNTTQFLAINPNGRIPALTDSFTDGQKINLFESGSIMQYLVDRYDTEYKISFPKGTREYYEMNNWLVSNCYKYC